MYSIKWYRSADIILCSCTHFNRRVWLSVTDVTVLNFTDVTQFNCSHLTDIGQPTLFYVVVLNWTDVVWLTLTDVTVLNLTDIGLVTLLYVVMTDVVVLITCMYSALTLTDVALHPTYTPARPSEGYPPFLKVATAL